MEFKILVKNASYLGSTKVIQFIVGLIRSKVNAIVLGTSGVGFVAQFLMLVKLSSDSSNLGMNEAVVKQIAENRSAEDANELIASSIKTYLATVILFIILSFVILIIFRNEIMIYAFGNNIFIKYYYLAVLTFPILIVNNVFFSILKGFKGIKQISRGRIAIIISNILIFVPLVILFKLKGAVSYLPISFLFSSLWNYYLANKYFLKPNGISFFKILKAPIKSAFRNEMLIFSGYGLVSSLIGTISIFTARSIIVRDLGIDQIGLYSPIIAWAGLFTGFLVPSFNTYLFPRFCEADTNKEVNGILNDAIRLATFSLIPLIVLAIPFRSILIPLFYSKEFLGAAIYLPYHFIGVVFNVWVLIFGQAMTPRGFIKQHTGFGIISQLARLGIVFLLVPILGLYGWTISFIFGPVLLFGIYYLFLKSKIKLSFTYSNIILMIYILSSALVLILIDMISGFATLNYFIGPLFLILTYFLLTKNEKKFVHGKIEVLKQKIR